MNFQDYVASQFEVKRINQGKLKGRICFKTPLGYVSLTPQDWEIVLKKMNEVEL